MNDIRSKGPYVGYSILSLDEKHRLTLNSKIADKLKKRSQGGVFYFSFFEEPEYNRLRHLRLFDEEYYLHLGEEVHPGILEEVRLQNNGRLQIPLPFYNFLGFTREHRYVLVIADRSGYFYRFYNLAYLAMDLPNHEEWGDFLPSVLEMSASSDKKLSRYLSSLVTMPGGGWRKGYEWLAERLQVLQQNRASLGEGAGQAASLSSSGSSGIISLRPLSSPFASWEETPPREASGYSGLPQLEDG